MRRGGDEELPTGDLKRLDERFQAFPIGPAAGSGPGFKPRLSSAARAFQSLAVSKRRTRVETPGTATAQYRASTHRTAHATWRPVSRRCSRRSQAVIANSLLLGISAAYSGTSV